MCGICGELRFDGGAAERDALERMNRELCHRGPDDSRVHVSGPVGFGQSRLAIIDLDRDASGPISNEDGSITVTFNGEIYNFRELREELRERGHRFRTGTDTEVLVHLYEEEGEAMLGRLRGMFAFALWDGKRRRLLAARDRLGQKPLVYTKLGGRLLFASEIKALLTANGVPARPRLDAIDAYLTRQYVPSPVTAYEGIYKLPPGHLLTCDLEGEVAVREYWRPPVPAPRRISPEEAREEVRRVLGEAVRMRMVADVPLGVLLSGGIDSGLVTALMARTSDRAVKTFSIGVHGFGSQDELPYARQVSERYGTEHTEHVVEPDAVGIIPWLVRQYDEPFADSSAIPTYYVSKVAREEVTVALSGDGGDEAFGGYNIYRSMYRWNRADVAPRALRRTIRGALEGLSAVAPSSNLLARMARVARMAESGVPERYRLHRTILKPEEKALGYTAAFAEAATANAFEREEPWDEGMDLLKWLMRHDQRNYLAEGLNTKVDIASMANSLEIRSPFQDHHVVHLGAALPSEHLASSDLGKVILRDLASELLPEEVARKPKTGFSIPLAHWLRNDLADLLRGHLLDDRALRRGLFRPRFVTKLVSEHLSGRRDWSNRLWALLCLELWFREFID